MPRSTHYDLSLPYITDGLEGVGGRIKARPEDFAVEEISLYEPSGEGSHLYVNLTKINQTTREVQVQLAELFGLRPQNIGTGGLKDKYSIATQTFSILFEKNDVSSDEAVTLIEDKLDVRVNWAKWHVNKFRAGHLIGNRFEVTITEIHMPMKRAMRNSQRIADAIHRTGVPNYYGEQRTGRAGKNIRQGWEILQGKHIQDRWLSKLLIAGYQSYLCNRYLSERVRRGQFSKLMLGDVAKKHDTGGIFWVNDLSLEQPRYEAQEISFTAPMYGYEMSRALGESALLEDEIFEESGLSMNSFKRLKVTGTRRMGRITPKIEVTEVPRGIKLSFDLRKGGFATTVLREFMKNEPGG